MPDAREPWAHIAHKDGKFVGVISADLGSQATVKMAKSWQRTVARDTGRWIAMGFTVTTVYSREEYSAFIDGMPFWEPPPKPKAKKKRGQDDLFAETT